MRKKSDKAEGEKKNGGENDGEVADFAHKWLFVFIVHARDDYNGGIIYQKEIGGGWKNICEGTIKQ